MKTGTTPVRDLPNQECRCPGIGRIGTRTGFGFSLMGGSRDSSMFLSCDSFYVFSLRFSTCYGNRNASPDPLRCEWQCPRTRTSKHGLLPEESTASYHQHHWSRPPPQHISLHSRANTRGKCQLDHWVLWRRWEFESYFRNYALIFVLSWPWLLPSLLKFSISRWHPFHWILVPLSPLHLRHSTRGPCSSTWLCNILPSNL